MLKKVVLLASVALATVGLAIPASASAAGTLFHKGVFVPVGNHVTIPFTGEISFDYPAIASSFGCVSHPQFTLESGHPSIGEVTKFELTTAKCEGTGLLKGCELVEDATNKPEIDVGANDMTITEAEFFLVFNAACIVPAAEFTFQEVTATPNNRQAIASVTLTGTGVDDVTALEVLITGTPNVAGGLAGTYGIG
jgi:hypothetical protein